MSKDGAHCPTGRSETPLDRDGARFAFAISITLVVLSMLWPSPARGQLAGTDLNLRGEFAVTVASEDLPTDLLDRASLLGRWRITFTGDGRYQFGRQDVGPVVSGEFAVEGGRLTLRGETGLLACGDAAASGAVAATYEWELADDRLQLIAVDDPCARRRHLLTTRTLVAFVPCPPLRAAGTLAATGAGDAPAAAPSGAAAGVDLPRPPVSADAAIDKLLGQMTDCWATRVPDRFLQLLSPTYLASRVPPGDDATRNFALTMGAPMAWDRVGDVEMVDAAHATALVRQISGDYLDVRRYAFVYEEGAWMWDGVVEGA